MSSHRRALRHALRSITLHALAVASLALAGCASDPGPPAEPAAAERVPFQTVVSEQAPRLAKLDGVVGTGVAGTTAEPVFVVKVRELTPELKAMIPGEIEGYKVEIQVTGGATP